MIPPSFTVFAKAAGLGLAVAAPVGPMSLLCMRRTLAQGWRAGLGIGAGIAIGDGLYAAVAALGLTAVSGVVLAHPRLLHGAAGFCLIGLGVRSLLARPAAAEAQAAPGAGSMVGAIVGAALLTLANPSTIVTFAAVFAGLAPAGGYRPAAALATVAGVFAGSLAWWGAVVAGVSVFRRGFGPRARRWIELGAGAVFAAFGVIELARALIPSA
jgi:threonine/homoserine/homoserine lactone efflux protein